MDPPHQCKLKSLSSAQSLCGDQENQLLASGTSVISLKDDAGFSRHGALEKRPRPKLDLSLAIAGKMEERSFLVGMGVLISKMLIDINTSGNTIAVSILFSQ